MFEWVETLSFKIDAHDMAQSIESASNPSLPIRRLIRHPRGRLQLVEVS